MKVGFNQPNSQQQQSQLNQQPKKYNQNNLDDSTQEQLQKLTKNNQLEWEKDQNQQSAPKRIYSLHRPQTQQSQKLKQEIETGRMDQAFFEDMNTKFETTKEKFQPDSCIADLLIDNNTKFREILMKGMIEMAKQNPRNKIRFLGQYLIANAPNIQ